MNKHRLGHYLSKYMDLDDDLLGFLSQGTLIQEFQRGRVLLKKGDVCNECYFILDGLIRSFYVDEEGEEVTSDFFMEEDVVSPSCYGTGAPSDLSLQCLEDTVASVGTPDVEASAYSKYPQLENLARVMAEKLMNSVKDRFDAFKMASPEKRCLSLVEHNPKLIQRVPQFNEAIEDLGRQGRGVKTKPPVLPGLFEPCDERPVRCVLPVSCRSEVRVHQESRSD